MKVLGIEGLTVAQLDEELENGARFVTYQYCVSVVLMTFRRSSNVFLIRGGGSAFAKGLKYTLLSFILGWWGLPWEPNIYNSGARGQ